MDPHRQGSRSRAQRGLGVECREPAGAGDEVGAGSVRAQLPATPGKRVESRNGHEKSGFMRDWRYGFLLETCHAEAVVVRCPEPRLTDLLLRARRDRLLVTAYLDERSERLCELRVSC
jgi:hypothetical protein